MKYRLPNRVDATHANRALSLMKTVLAADRAHRAMSDLIRKLLALNASQGQWLQMTARLIARPAKLERIHKTRQFAPHAPRASFALGMHQYPRAAQKQRAIVR